MIDHNEAGADPGAASFTLTPEEESTMTMTTTTEVSTPYLDAPTAVLRVESIYERMAAILAEMPAIGKGQRNEQQGFMYRGHDDVMNELNPLLSKYRVFFTPRVLKRVTGQRTTSRGGVMYEVNLLVQYTFYGPAGDEVRASAWGEGTDSGDKSTNKAMTMALKNVLAQTFAVSTAELSHDTDGDTPEPTTGRVPGRRPPPQPSAPVTSDGVPLRHDAPWGWKAINEQLKALDPAMPWTVWVAQALHAKYGVSKLADVSEEHKKDAGIRVGNGVAHLAETLGGREFPPPTRKEVVDAFAWADSIDVRLDGPDEPLDPDEAAERLAAAEATPEALPGVAAPQEAVQRHRDPTDDPADVPSGEPDPKETP